MQKPHDSHRMCPILLLNIPAKMHCCTYQQANG